MFARLPRRAGHPSKEPLDSKRIRAGTGNIGRGTRRMRRVGPERYARMDLAVNPFWHDSGIP
jgi:hypothetical protein